jgi:ABC-type transport system involved in cytochrome c biogenesis ATPase subunit
MSMVNGLRKRFGPTLALDGMSFTVPPGQVTGFIGPNGAGKSTTMRVILGLDAPDAGTALIGGRPYRSLRHPLRQLGSLLDAGALQPSRSARNHLRWLAYSQGLPKARVDEVIRQAGLEQVARRKAGGFSLGMRQRLGIAAALLGVERPGLGGGPDTWKGEGLWHPRGSTPWSCVNARSGWSLNYVSRLVRRPARSFGSPTSSGCIARHCVPGSGRLRSMPASVRGPRAATRKGSRSWSGRIVSCGGRTRS